MKKKRAVRIDVESFALLRIMVYVAVGKIEAWPKKSDSYCSNTEHGPLCFFFCAEYLCRRNNDVSALQSYSLTRPGSKHYISYLSLYSEIPFFL